MSLDTEMMERVFAKYNRAFRELAKGPGAPPSLEELIEQTERELAEEARAATV